jgi:cell division protease FtsH
VFGHDHGQPFLGREFSAEPDYSDDVAREIDGEIRRIVEEAHQVARDILSSHRTDLDNVSEILLKRETIEADQFERLLAGESEASIFGPDEPTSPTEPPQGTPQPTFEPRRPGLPPFPKPGAEPA